MLTRGVENTGATGPKRNSAGFCQKTGWLDPFFSGKAIPRGSRTRRARSSSRRSIDDAALIAEVIDVDTQGPTQGRDPRAVPGAPAPPRLDAAAFSSLPPTQREIEGAGGEMWYEARHIGAGRAA